MRHYEEWMNKEVKHKLGFIAFSVKETVFCLV